MERGISRPNWKRGRGFESKFRRGVLHQRCLKLPPRSARAGGACEEAKAQIHHPEMRMKESGAKMEEAEAANEGHKIGESLKNVR